MTTDASPRRSVRRRHLLDPPIRGVRRRGLRRRALRDRSGSTAPVTQETRRGRTRTPRRREACYLPRLPRRRRCVRPCSPLLRTASRTSWPPPPCRSDSDFREWWRRHCMEPGDCGGRPRSPPPHRWNGCLVRIGGAPIAENPCVVSRIRRSRSFRELPARLPLSAGDRGEFYRVAVLNRPSRFSAIGTRSSPMSRRGSTSTMRTIRDQRVSDHRLRPRNRPLRGAVDTLQTRLQRVFLSYGLVPIVHQPGAGAISAGYGRLILLMVLPALALLPYIGLYLRFLRQPLKE